MFVLCLFWVTPSVHSYLLFLPLPKKKSLELPFVGGTGWLLHWQPKHTSPMVLVLVDRGTIIPVC